jgi:hypothetical protein
MVWQTVLKQAGKQAKEMTQSGVSRVFSHNAPASKTTIAFGARRG